MASTRQLLMPSSTAAMMSSRRRRILHGDDLGDLAVGGPVHPVVEQLGGLRQIGCGRRPAGPLRPELTGPDQPRAGPLLERLEPRPLAVGEVLGVLHERVALPLMETASSSSALTLLGRQLAADEPAALALGPGPGSLAAAWRRSTPRSARRQARRYPLDHVEGSMTHLALGQQRQASCLILAPSVTSMARLCSRIELVEQVEHVLPVPSCAQPR